MANVPDIDAHMAAIRRAFPNAYVGRAVGAGAVGDERCAAIAISNENLFCVSDNRAEVTRIPFSAVAGVDRCGPRCLRLALVSGGVLSLNFDDEIDDLEGTLNVFAGQLLVAERVRADGDTTASATFTVRGPQLSWGATGPDGTRDALISRLKAMLGVRS